MLRKLIKYDFMSLHKVFIPLWIAFVAVSMLNRLTAWGFLGRESVFGNIVSGVSIFAYVLMMIALNGIGVILVIQRFYTGLLKDEGYLMFTLPVKPWQHIISKGITATVLLSVNALLSMLSVLLLAASEEVFALINQGLGFLREQGFSITWLGVLVFFVLLTSTVKSLYQIYASIALGHLAPKHRAGWAFGAYIGISIVLSVIASIFGSVLAFAGVNGWLTTTFNNVSPPRLVDTVLWFAIVLNMVQIVGFFVIPERILSKKLNLE